MTAAAAANPAKAGSAADASIVVQDETPVAERLISDVETLKAISDPTRLRIIETMVTRPAAPWTAKELAAALDVPQTRLYHHLDLLLETDLVRVAEQRVVSGIIETRYRVAALSLRLDPRLVGAGGAAASATHEVLATIFDEVRADVERALAKPPRDDDPTLAKPFVTRGLARLSPERGAELRRRMQALLEEYDEPSAGPDTETIRFLIAMYVDPSKEASRG